MISPSYFLKTALCGTLTMAMPLGATAADYEVDTTSSGNKRWSLPSTWAGGDGVPNGADDRVTFGFNASGGIGLYADLEEIELAELKITGDAPATRGIYGYDDVASTVRIGNLVRSGTGGLAFRNSGEDAKLSIEIGTLSLGSGSILEIGNIYEAGRTRYSVESFVVDESSTVEGILRFNNIRNRVASENILDLGTLNLSGQILLGGRGNTGGIVRVTALTGATTGNLHVYRDATHNGTSGTLEIDSRQADATSIYHGKIRDYYSDTIENGAPEGTVVSLDVRKLGGGTQVFDSTDGHYYSGGTSIEDGVLAVDNTTGSGLGSGAVAVSGTGTLAGNGRLELKAQPIEIKAGGTLAPGAHLETGVATLTISGAQTPGAPLLSLEEGSTLFFRLEADGSSDRIAFTEWHENALLMATQGITIDASGVNEGRFNLLSFDTITTDELSTLAAGFNAQTLGSGFDSWQGVFGYDTAGGENVLWLEVSVIPEPGSAVLTLLGLGALGWAARLRKQRRD